MSLVKAFPANHKAAEDQITGVRSPQNGSKPLLLLRSPFPRPEAPTTGINASMPKNATALTSHGGLTLNYLADDAAQAPDFDFCCLRKAVPGSGLRDNAMKE